MSVTLELPSFPPKQRPKFKRRDENVVAYSKQDYSELRKAIEAQWDGAPLAGRVALEMDFRVPLPKRVSKARRAAMLAGEIRPSGRNVDDLLRPLMDALVGVVVEDERQLVRLSGIVVYGEPGVSVAVGNVTVFPAIAA